MSYTITLYDNNNDEIDHLTQWDSGITIKFNVENYHKYYTYYATFTNTYREDSYTVAATVDTSAQLSVKVPNILLQDYATLIVHVYSYSDTTKYKQTVRTFRLPVRRASEHSDDIDLSIDYSELMYEISTVEETMLYLNITK